MRDLKSHALPCASRPQAVWDRLRYGIWAPTLVCALIGEERVQERHHEQPAPVSRQNSARRGLRHRHPVHVRVQGWRRGLSLVRAPMLAGALLRCWATSFDVHGISALLRQRQRLSGRAAPALLVPQQRLSGRAAPALLARLFCLQAVLCSPALALDPPVSCFALDLRLSPALRASVA